jgi:hypothetical protein
VYNTPTATDRDTPSTNLNFPNREFEKRIQALANGKETITLEFTRENWKDWQTIRVSAIDDSVEEGVDVLNFPSQPSYLAFIQGPLACFGEGSDTAPPIQPPFMLPGETDDDTFTPPCGAVINNGTLYVIEEHQVDYLIINNLNARGNLTSFGTLTNTQLTGFNMQRDLVISGELKPDGIFYGDFEVIEINLGNGTDSFTVANTSAAIHVLNLAGGDDAVFVEEISGPFIGKWLAWCIQYFLCGFF